MILFQIKVFGRNIKDTMSSMFLGYLVPKKGIPFSHQKTKFLQVTMRFLASTHIHIFLHILIKKKPPKNSKPDKPNKPEFKE